MIDPKEARMLPQTVEVQKQRKSLHYTITTIGNAEDLRLWRKEQERLEVAWQKAQEAGRAKRRANAVSVVKGEKSANDLTDLEKAEIDYRRRRNRKREPLKDVPLRTYEEIMGRLDPPQPPSLLTKFKQFVAKLWRK